MFSSNQTNAAVVSNYIEDVFSTYLYTGTGASLTITNNIDLSTKGGLTWIKSRSDATDHKLTDTARGVTKALISDTTAAQTTDTTGLTAFGTTGFTIGANTDYNTSAATYASWTFRKQAKFFDVVTYTGTGSNRTIAHSLGSVPGCIIVKRTDTTGAWQVYHSSLANTEYLVLNTTAAKATGATRWNSTTPTSTVFSLGTDATVNASGGTYVAYIYASNAGGFGLTGADNVITCGSYTGNGSATGPIVTLGYEPQWIMIKGVSSAQSWVLFDSMRGLTALGGDEEFLQANAADAALTGVYDINPTATSFQVNNSSPGFNGSGQTYIYIAIRRGPMKVPTDATTVFSPVAYTGTGAARVLTAGFSVDLTAIKRRDNNGNAAFFDRLRGNGNLLEPPSTSAETIDAVNFPGLSGAQNGTNFPGASFNASAVSWINWAFRRAPQFFDEVCYTGTGSAATFNHNLGVVPELMIMKSRTGSTGWGVYTARYGATGHLVLNTTAAAVTTGSTLWNSTAPTSTVFSVGTAFLTNDVGANYVSYLFATCAGVSKVGSYTGNGTTQTIDCGFTAGARFVLIKKTSATGDWYVYDTARGMTSLTDPYLLLNSTVAETASLGSVTTVTTGFALNSAIVAAINTNAATYIFLAIA